MAFDVIAMTIALIAASAAPMLTGWLEPQLRRCRGLSKRARGAWLVAAGAILASALFALIVGRLPVPHVHDEFAYLLGADTFLHGRLTNPTPPHWESFETFHVIYQPTYQMKYPPAQAGALALGALLGHPVIGVWLCMASASAAAYWMLRAWLPAKWAMAGGAVVWLNPSPVLFWGNAYWGGAIAMTGGRPGLRSAASPAPPTARRRQHLDGAGAAPAGQYETLRGADRRVARRRCHERLERTANRPRSRLESLGFTGRSSTGRHAPDRGRLDGVLQLSSHGQRHHHALSGLATNLWQPRLDLAVGSSRRRRSR